MKKASGILLLLVGALLGFTGGYFAGGGGRPAAAPGGPMASGATGLSGLLSELERDPRESIRRILYWGSGAGQRGAHTPGSGAVGRVRRDVGFLTQREPPAAPPPWLTDADIDHYAGEFARTGFRGGLNWYRNVDRNWELLAPWAGAKVTVPALYVTGDRDLVLTFRGMDKLLPALKAFVPDLRESLVLSGCGHWTQQERPDEVNAAMLRFLETVR